MDAIELKQLRSYTYTTSTIALRNVEREFQHLQLELSRDALPVILTFHQGYRKDQYTPDFMHPVGLVQVVLEHQHEFQRAGFDLDSSLAIGALHDVPEDNQDITKDDLRRKFSSTSDELVDVVVNGAFAMSKRRNGIVMPAEQHYRELGKTPQLFILKLIDRGLNTRTIFGLSVEKQKKYVLESILLLSVAKRAIKFYNPAARVLAEKFMGEIQEVITAYPLMAKRLAQGLDSHIPDALIEARALRQQNVLRKRTPRTTRPSRKTREPATLAA